jgi:hypothetical protein
MTWKFIQVENTIEQININIFADICTQNHLENSLWHLNYLHTFMIVAALKAFLHTN